MAKYLYEFFVTRVTNVDKEEITKDADGNEVKTIKKVKENTLTKFLILKPNRNLTDEADLYFSSQVFEFVKRGLMPASMLTKRYDEDGGLFSKNDEEKRKELVEKLTSRQKALTELTEKTEKSEEDQKSIEGVTKELITIFEEATVLENKKSQIFEYTAEAKARNRTLFWWILFLSHYQDEKGDIKPVFEGKEFKEKLKNYDNLIENQDDEFWNEAIKKLTYYITMWNFGAEPEDFDKLPGPDAAKY